MKVEREKSDVTVSEIGESISIDLGKMARDLDKSSVSAFSNGKLVVYFSYEHTAQVFCQMLESRSSITINVMGIAITINQLYDNTYQASHGNISMNADTQSSAIGLLIMALHLHRERYRYYLCRTGDDMFIQATDSVAIPRDAVCELSKQQYDRIAAT